MEEWMFLNWKGSGVMLTQKEYKEYESALYCLRVASTRFEVQMHKAQMDMILERGAVRYGSQQFEVKKRENKSQ